MGKRCRNKTRWRTLTITDENENSDSNSSSGEESTTASSDKSRVATANTPNGVGGHYYPRNKYHHSNGGGHHQHHYSNNSNNGRLSTSSAAAYSSQSTPTRRYHHYPHHHSNHSNYHHQHHHQHSHQHDGAKSTRSSSTASENKVTFNEDEYTRITTPRQDVLFKKGYLNKPKPTTSTTTMTGSTISSSSSSCYQTQISSSSTGNSTGNNSTGNGTPDHQSTDLEFESQFVFSNGFVDQNGIYYVNSFEPYPLVMYNPQAYYPDYEFNNCHPTSGSEENYNSETNRRGSLGESTSPPTTTTPTEEDEHDPHFDDGKETVVVAETSQETTGSVVVECDQEDDEKKRAETPSSSIAIRNGCQAEPPEESKSDPQQLLLQSLSSPSNDGDTPEDSDDTPTKKYDLKPDAEEFVPRSYHQPNHHVLIKLPPNFLPIPIPISPMGGPFIATATPFNFVPHPHFIPATPTSDYDDEEEEEVEEVEEESKPQEPIKEAEAPPAVTMATVVAASRQPSRTQSKLVEAPAPRPRKQQQQQQQQQRTNQRRAEKQPVVVVQKEKLVAPVAPSNQWISVSNRKAKRKGRVEAEPIGFEEEEPIRVQPEPISVQGMTEVSVQGVVNAVDDDQFESYDVALLEDVVKVDEVVTSEVKSPPEEAKPPPQPQPTQPKKKSQPKSKTSKQKPKQQKRVMITDVDLSGLVTAPSPSKPEPIKVPVVKEEVVAPNVEMEVVKKPVTKTPPKKSKRKSPTVKVTTPDTSSSSYDFLLSPDTSAMTDKTNVEISQELDKLIQRGMYNSLEEKMRSLNVHSDDDFFKSFVEKPRSRESSIEKQNTAGCYYYTAKTPDFGRVVATKVVDNNNKEQGLYPITEAVKEWMHKTRESTPDVEILKSPTAILEEFGKEIEDSSDDEDLPKEDEEEEIEIYDSKYGQNEDFLKIQADVLNNKNKSPESSANFPKHGNLPYRAICCSIM